MFRLSDTRALNQILKKISYWQDFTVGDLTNISTEFLRKQYMGESKWDFCFKNPYKAPIMGLDHYSRH